MTHKCAKHFYTLLSKLNIMRSITGSVQAKRITSNVPGFVPTLSIIYTRKRVIHSFSLTHIWPNTSVRHELSWMLLFPAWLTLTSSICIHATSPLYPAPSHETLTRWEATSYRSTKRSENHWENEAERFKRQSQDNRTAKTDPFVLWISCYCCLP